MNVVDGTEVVATDWNPSWAWAAGAMTSTLDDLHVWVDTLASRALVDPAVLPAEGGYGLGMFEFAGWRGHNGSVPGYQTVAVHLVCEQTTLVVLTNTDVPIAGGLRCDGLATVITEILTPDHVYPLGI